MAYSPFFSPSPSLAALRPSPVKAELHGDRRGGKTALQWHLLRQRSAALGRPIECVACEKPHDTPPPLGRCVCGGCMFGIRSADAAQPSLPLEAARG